MTPSDLKQTLESRFKEWDLELEQEEDSFLAKHPDAAERIITEEEITDHCLEETRKKFDQLLDLLDKEHVDVPSGNNLNSGNYTNNYNPIVIKSIQKKYNVTKLIEEE